MTLPFDTNTMAWPRFVVGAIRRYPAGGLLMLGPALLFGGVMAMVLESVGPGDMWISVSVSAGLSTLIVMAQPLNNYATRVAYVIRRDESGQVYIDEQRWWRLDAMKFPDGVKFSTGSRRIPVIDAQDDTDIRAFNPWIAPMPVHQTQDSKGLKKDPADRPISSATVFGVKAAMRVAARLTQWREPGEGEALRQGLMIAVIGGSLLAIYMAGQRAVEVFTGG